ncbi:TIGR01777 family oxidoreductase [Ignavibacteria bacterium]|nr:TIGR01777 family oxidoreductase [Bacteroidota bacterium]MCZ2131988.1 TIGR01777 family oxidoreductase [Bacteroidota bacterium]
MQKWKEKGNQNSSTSLVWQAQLYYISTIMRRRIVITGATGLIGKQLSRKLSAAGYELTICSRNIKKARSVLPFASSFVKWDAENTDELCNATEVSCAVIHLAGETLAQRWTSQAKRRILESRANGSAMIARAIAEAKNPPEFLFSASAIGYYGNTRDIELDENSPPGTDFPAHVCVKWEDAVKPAELVTRVVYGRIGVVLDKYEGALSKLLPTFRLYVGGALGTGRQWWSWIHSADAVDMILWAMENSKVSGAMNICSPNPVRMKELAIILSNILNRPSWLDVPDFILKATLGEMATIALSSQKIYPKKALSLGYQPKFSNLREALTDIVAR